MSTITTEFTKEQLIASAHARIEFAEMMLAGELEPLKERTWSIELELARIALASLEAEPVALRDERSGSGSICKQNGFKELPHGTELFAAPPAPETAEREMLKRLAIILSGSDAPGEIRSLTVTAKSFVDRCKVLAKERDECRMAMLQGKAEPRNDVRREHAQWSQSTFGDVGPVGPLKHLSKEALEAAAEPGDLSEWADMQFLLWDAQRRAGITDEQITEAMIEKLTVNKARQWPEPKDGEPRLHIKTAPRQEV